LTTPSSLPQPSRTALSTFGIPSSTPGVEADVFAVATPKEIAEQEFRHTHDKVIIVVPVIIGSVIVVGITLMWVCRPFPEKPPQRPFLNGNFGVRAQNRIGTTPKSVPSIKVVTPPGCAPLALPQFSPRTTVAPFHPSQPDYKKPPPSQVSSPRTTHPGVPPPRVSPLPAPAYTPSVPGPSTVTISPDGRLKITRTPLIPMRESQGAFR
jgi:hypothetical protein